MACANELQAQLVYVNAEDDFIVANQNLFPSAGGALSTALVNNAAPTADNKWGWIEAGAPDAGGAANVYESNTENSPELRMHVAAPNGSYDAYAVFWVDVNVQWNIRAGLTSNPGANTLFGRTNADGATVGTFAASTIWTTPPGDDPNAVNDDDDSDANNILNPLTGDNPFVDHVPGAGGGFRMFLAPLGMVTAAGGAGFDVFVDDGPTTNEANRTRFDGVAYVATGADVTLEATIDRSTGNLTIANTTGNLLNISRYAISSPSGALDATKWDSISVGGNTTITEASPWTVSTNGAILSGNWLLAENETTPTNGAQLAATSGAFNLGDVWVKSTFEDVLVSLELVGGAKVQLLPTYVGDAIDPGDFDGDGDVDFTDYSVLISNLHVPQTAGQTTVQFYKKGDMNNNGVVNRDDFIAFRNAYFTANPGSGQAEFNAMIAAGVPEPTTLVLVGLASGMLVTRRRRQMRGQLQNFTQGLATMMHRRNQVGRFATFIGAALAAALVAAAAQAENVTGWARYQGNATTATFQGGSEATNSPIFGTGAANAIDDSGIWGSTTNIHLEPSEEAVLHGRVQILGHTGANREFRFGMWKKVVQPTNPNTNPTTGWLGYMALNGAGTGLGRLEAKNPDSDFNNALFISDQGGNSIATESGPIPAAGSPLLDGAVNGPNDAGAGIGRYFILAQASPNGNAGFANNLWYTFEIRVGRYGANEATVSASLIADAQPANGDFNNNGVVDTADYTVWRNNLNTNFALPNRGATTGPVSMADYNTWKTNFGATSGVPYSYNIGGGLDFNGNFPIDAVANPAGTYSDHVTFDFDRVGFLFGGALDADQATFQNITINKNTISTLDLLVNPTTGATSIRNNLAETFDIAYYEITSATNSLRRSGGWTSIDSTEGGDPIGVGWDEAAGSSDAILSEANLTGALSLAQNGSINLGNAFKTTANGGTQGTQDLRLFVGLTDGSVLRGTVTYGAGGSGSVVPEPGTLGLLTIALLGMATPRRRREGA
jgi:hypothetical protein